MNNHMHFCRSAKHILRVRDQRQLDNEDLEQYLSQAQRDHERALISRDGHPDGIAGFFQRKMDDIKGISPAEARNTRLIKLASRISEVTSCGQ